MPQKIIFHIDMDAFFASCEEALNPSLRGKPLIVGGTKKDLRSIVSCPNYLARALGIRTAMPLTQALRLAPDGNFIRGTRGLYSDYSKKVMKILYKYTPVVQPASIDEAYLDVSLVLPTYKNNPELLAGLIKEDIKKTLTITCSIGISSKKVVTKIASKQNKPDGITYVPPGSEKEFLAPLPVQRIPGVGKSTFSKLSKYGIKTIGDILKFDKEFFTGSLGMFSEYLYNVANGIDDRDVHIGDYERKSLSHENTFLEDTDNMKFLKAELYRLLEKSCNRLRKHKLLSRNITVKVKYNDFTVNQRSMTRDCYSNLEMDYFEDAHLMMKQLLGRKKLRLLGVRFSELTEEDGSTQESIFVNEDKMKTIASKMDTLRRKYDFDIIKFGKTFKHRS